MKVRYLMYVGDEEEVGVKIVVERYSRVASGMPAGEVAHLSLAAPGDFEFEGAGLP